MGDDNVWLQGRRTEMDSLNRILLSITDRAVRSAGVTDQPHRSAIVPQHLRKAAQRQHDQATERATTALARLSTTGAAVSFASVAREADVSTDFLYRQPQLRQRIQQMRTPINRTVNAVDSEGGTPPAESAPVRALSAQLKELRRGHNDQVSALQKALAVAQGENLALRRKLAAYE